MSEDSASRRAVLRVRERTLSGRTSPPNATMSAIVRPQSYANHRAIPPASYLLAGLVLAVEAGHRLWLALGTPDFWTIWGALAWVALFLTWAASRLRARIVQDRVVRLEMQLRLERLLGPGRRADIARLELPQLVALRFEGDALLPGLVERVLAGELVRPNDIKRAVKDWQADWLRV